MLLDQLAAGIDPARTTIFTHSAVPALNRAHAHLPGPPSRGHTLLLRQPGPRRTRPARHLEVTRTLARRFNDRYSPEQPVFTVPEALVGQAPTLLGVDGTKMSKSRGNAIELRASAD